MRYIRSYFGEAEGDDCGHCDNCRDRPAKALAARAQQDERAVPKVDVTEAAKEGPPFAEGDRVHHPQFGDGAVQGVEEDRITVAFAEAGDKVVHAEYLLRSDLAASRGNLG